MPGAVRWAWQKKQKSARIQFFKKHVGAACRVPPPHGEAARGRGTAGGHCGVPACRGQLAMPGAVRWARQKKQKSAQMQFFKKHVAAYEDGD